MRLIRDQAREKPDGDSEQFREKRNERGEIEPDLGEPPPKELLDLLPYDDPIQG